MINNSCYKMVIKERYKMIVYVEQVIFDNLIINYVLLFLTGKLLCKNTKFVRLFLADFLGTAFSAVYPLINLNAYLMLAVKILLGVSMILIAFNLKTFKNFLLTFFCFLFVTAICAGMCFAIILTLYPQSSFNGGTMVYKGLPMGIFVLLVFLLFKFVFEVVKNVRKNSKIKENICNLLFCYKDIKLKIKAYIDTGNLLSYEQKPIIIISYPTFRKLLGITNQDFLMGNYNLQNSFYISTQTANGNNRMLIFDIDKIVLMDKQEKVLDCMIGLSLNDLENKFGCNALIGSNAIMEENLC